MGYRPGVRVEIFYCPVWNGYDRRAAGLAAVLQRAGHEADALEGEKSQYDVVADGAVVFSKQREGRFPEDDEILALIAPGD
jgi:selT/selW/selH-like putative selenoprotein